MIRRFSYRCEWKSITFLLAGLCLALTSVAQAQNKAASEPALSDDDLRWREKIGFNPQVHASVENSSDSQVFARVPYAFYPTANQLEVAFDLEAARKLLPAGTPTPVSKIRSIEVRVQPAVVAPELIASMPMYYAKVDSQSPDPQQVIFRGVIELDSRGRGHGLFTLPKLTPGNYRVIYAFGGAELVSARTFRRTGFEWENCAFGSDAKVYPPFTPVVAEGNIVGVVDRQYTLNAFGLLDSVISQGRELLAEPIRVHALDAQGQRVTWNLSEVRARVLQPNLARSESTATSSLGTLKTVVSIEEDGCAKVQWTLEPAPAPAQIQRLWIEIALKDTEAPLCHLVGMDSMRHNFAGVVPRGGKVTWINQTWRPARFEIEPFTGPTPASYQVWESRQLMHWGKQRWNFAPYLWLGAEARGLAWFGDHIQGYSADGQTSLQRLFIEPGKVVLRIDLIQKPIILSKARQFEFGLQASPTKPMREDWRRYDVPGAGGLADIAWGGFNCSDKVPANRDWTIVDKIMEGRKTRKVDQAWFTNYAQKHSRIGGGGGAKPQDLRAIPLTEAKANKSPWLTEVLNFAAREARTPEGVGTTVYFEEHQTSGMYPEVAEFMDEWCDTSFARFRYFDYPRTWGPEIRAAAPESYRNFAVFYANDWMKRGVGIYYDNTFPKVDLNVAKYASRDIDWSSCIWAHRDYYKRVWKRSRELMEQGISPLPLHTVGHVTNCQVLPYTTWWDATLGVESPGHWESQEKQSPQVRLGQISERGFVILPTPQNDKPGRALPYPPDYLRAMEMGRTAGVISYYLHPLRSADAFGGISAGFGTTEQGKDPRERAHRLLSDLGMGLVHEIRSGNPRLEVPEIAAVRRAIDDFGFGQPQVSVINYWQTNTPVRVGDERVKWIAMTRSNREPLGLIVLQSYSENALNVPVTFPGATQLVDLLTRQIFTLGSADTVSIPMDADYGTRVLLASLDPAKASLLPMASNTVFVEDMQLGLGSGCRLMGSLVSVQDDPRQQGNRVLRIIPGHPAQNGLVLAPQSMNDTGDQHITLRFRVPEAPTKPGRMSLFRTEYRRADKRQYSLDLALNLAAGGAVTLVAETPRLSFEGGKSQPIESVRVEPKDRPVAVRSSDLTSWQVLEIALRGPQQTIRLNGQVIFEASDSQNLTGSLRIGPAWGDMVPRVEIDDIRIERIDGQEKNKR